MTERIVKSGAQYFCVQYPVERDFWHIEETQILWVLEMSLSYLQNMPIYFPSPTRGNKNFQFIPSRVLLQNCFLAQYFVTHKMMFDA